MGTLNIKAGVQTIRWIARIWSILSITLILLFFVGGALSEGFSPSQVTLRQWVGFLLFPLGVVVGMILAWWKEGLGGAITVVSFLAALPAGDYSAGAWGPLVFFVGPGFIFLACWYFSPKLIRK